MRGSTPYRVYAVAAAGFGGLIALGAFLDAVANARALVSPLLTYVGSALLIAATVLAYVAVRKRPIEWHIGGRAVGIRALRTVSTAWVIGMVVLLWIPRFLPPPTGDAVLAIVQVDINDDAVFPALDIKLRNPSGGVVFLSEAVLHVERVVPLALPSVRPSVRDVTARYDVELPVAGAPYARRMPLSHEIPPNGTDRIVVSVGRTRESSDATNRPFLCLLTVDLVYNEDKRTVSSGRLVLYLPPNPEYAGYFSPRLNRISPVGFTFEELANENSSALDELGTQKAAFSPRARRLLERSDAPINLRGPQLAGWTSCEGNRAIAYDHLQADLSRHRQLIPGEPSIRVVKSQFGTAIPYLLRALRSCTDPAVVGHVKGSLAWSRFMLGEIDDALAGFEDVATHHPGTEEARRAQSFAHLLRTCRSDAASLEAFRLGLQYAKVGDLGPAAQHLATAAQSRCGPLSERAKDTLHQVGTRSGTGDALAERP